MKLIITALTVSLLSFSVNAAQSTQEEVLVLDSQKEFLPQIKSQASWGIDHINNRGYEVFGPVGMKAKLKEMGVSYRDQSVANFLKSKLLDYPDFKTIESELKRIHETYPDTSELISIGKTSEDRDLWVMKIAKNPKEDRVLPEVKYISSMHGNEITGRELMMKLIEDLLSCYKNNCNTETADLINNTEIFIMPSMNPDGSERATRGNANYADLNRDFPDFSTTDDQNTMESRQPETQAVMKFQAERNFSLSANFHGGAEVVNYMWDTLDADHPFKEMLVGLSKDYASRVEYMKNSADFTDGITNGFAWYEVDGGMQDWSYHWHGDTQFTIELSNAKWPNYSRIPDFYSENKEALLKFLRNVHQGAGFHFLTPDQRGHVEIFRQMEDKSEKSLGSYPFNKSEFYKVLEPGRYKFMIRSDGFEKDVRVLINVAADYIYPEGNYALIP